MSSEGLKAILFWDIDGTLLTTGRAGIFAWEASADEIAGYHVDLQMLQTAGLTDFAIGRVILEKLKLPSDGELLSRIVRQYEGYLPEMLPRRQGRVLEGVKKLLEHMHNECPELMLYLLTGNTTAGAKAKLNYYGLYDFFKDGAFANQNGNRIDIAKRALSMATDESPVPSDRIFVIGDTPADIQCGQAIGAKTIAIASGDYSLEILESYAPWRVLPGLGDIGRFLSLLEESN